MKMSNILWLLPFLSFIIGYCTLSWVLRPVAFSMPSLITLSLHDATKKASEQQLNVRILRQKDDPELAEGTVVDQIPCANSTIKQGQTIFLVITKKPSRLSAPKIIGLSKTVIQSLLTERGISHKSFSLPSPLPINTCIAQLPDADIAIGKEGMVIYYSEGPIKTVVMPNLKGKTLEQIQDFVTENELKLTPHHIAVPEPHTCSTCHIYDQKPAPGSLIQRDPGLTLHVLIGP